MRVDMLEEQVPNTAAGVAADGEVVEVEENRVVLVRVVVVQAVLLMLVV